MRVLDILGFIGGAAFAAVGIYFAPSPAYDPKGWGYCGVHAAFPISVPETVPQFGLDYYACEIDPLSVGMLIAYLVVVILISGAFASRIGEKVIPARGAWAVALVIVTVLVGMVIPSERINVVPTLLLGLAIVAGVITIAYAGGALAKRNA